MYAVNPTSESKWKIRMLRTTRTRKDLMPRTRGERVHMIQISYPEIPMCQSGKSGNISRRSRGKQRTHTRQ